MNRLGLVIVAALIVVCGLDTSEAWARRSRGNSRARAAAAAAAKARLAAYTQVQVDRAKRVMASAEMDARTAGSEHDRATSRISSAREALAAARADLKQASEQVHQVEDDLVTAAGENSPISLARDKMEDAEDDLQEIEHRLLNSDDYKGKLTEAQNGANHVEQVVKLRHETLENSQKRSAALAKYAAAKEEYAKLRAQIVDTDPAYLAATKAARDAQHAEALANQEATNGGLSKMSSGEDLRHATAVANTARQKVTQGEALISKLNVNKGKTGSKTSTGSGQKKK